MSALRYKEIPPAVLATIVEQAGLVLKTEVVAGGLNSEIAARVHTEQESLFIKGLRTDHPRAWTQAREAGINPYVRGIAPALKWRVRDHRWDILAFEDVAGEHADYRPGSADLAATLAVMLELHGIAAPDGADVAEMPQRMRSYVDDADEVRFFDGDRLLHTDWKPDNVLISRDGATRLVDWAWPTRGAGWIDPALWAIWLIAAGYSAGQAEALAAQHPAWQDAPPAGIDAFARAQHRLWGQIAERADGDEFGARMHRAATAWSTHRGRPGV
ncbi:aminoglycoside phosphotransferase [Streptomyces sp. NPDC101213]|uniref:aminoglycoside phosphotransferase n=1 Tax=Streptomyces sp. NPDC101213 TaxID=3366130 RepID=UPI00381FE34A